MTDRIDELQRLHEAATKGPWKQVLGCFVDHAEGVAADCINDEDADLIVAMRNALPALLRVARAAKNIAGNVPLDIDPRIRWLEVQVGREEWAELLAALGELEREEGR